MPDRPLLPATPGPQTSDPIIDGRVVIELHGDLDLAVKGELLARVDEAADRCEHIVFDMRHVPFMDSTGLAVIASAIHRVGSSGTVTIRDMQPLPLTALRISGLGNQISLETS